MDDRAASEQRVSLTPDRLSALIDAAGAGLLERDTAVRLSLLAALAGEHVLLIGPPGTAKSALARRLHHAFADARYFERLLTRFSTPEELFGPLSLKALEHDRYERLTAGFLPSAGIAFLDEVFKANSAILNALLTLLNERLFDNGTERRAVPLVAVVGASNEVPADEALHAFYDRFLVRVPVAPVGDEAFAALLALQGGDAAIDAASAGDAGNAVPGAPRSPAPITGAERAAVAAAAVRVALGEPFVAACTALRRRLAAREQALSDRRWRQFVGLVQTAAASEGRSQLDALDLWLAPYVASATPADVPAIAAWFDDEVLTLPPTEAPWLGRAVEAFEKQLGIEQRMPAEGSAFDSDAGAGKLAVARALGSAGGDGGAAGDHDDGASGRMQRIVSARLEARFAKKWSETHIEARVAQVAEIEAQVAAALDAARAERQALDSALAARLWIAPSIAQRWLARHDAAQAMFASFAARLAAVRAGFAALPVDAGATGEAPAPVALEPAGAAVPVE
ncbi:MAG: AAA family ATPase [Rubrivivax sp.]|nr:AAA family ATPase [Rubrivivax sp.]